MRVRVDGHKTIFAIILASKRPRIVFGEKKAPPPSMGRSDRKNKIFYAFFIKVLKSIIEFLIFQVKTRERDTILAFTSFYLKN